MAQNRMAGDKMKEAAENGDLSNNSYTPPSEEEIKQSREERARRDKSAQADGYRDNVERNRGTDWYNEALQEGLQKGTKGGRYTGAEVRAEMRAGRGDKTVEEMREYYQGLIDDGVKFNDNARDFLADKHDLNFKNPGADLPEEDATPTPTPTPSPSPSPEPPVTGGLYEPPGGIGIGNPGSDINQNNDINTSITGNNNTVNNNQDNSIKTFGSYGSAERAQMLRNKYVADVSRFRGVS